MIAEQDTEKSNFVSDLHTKPIQVQVRHSPVQVTNMGTLHRVRGESGGDCWWTIDGLDILSLIFLTISYLVST